MPYQPWYRRPISAYIQKILAWFLNDLATGVGRGGGGVDGCPLLQEDILWKIVDNK